MGKRGGGGGGNHAKQRSRPTAKRAGLALALGGNRPGGSASGNGNGNRQATAPPKLAVASKLTQKREELRKQQVARHRAKTTASSLEELVGAATQTARAFEQKEQAQAGQSDGGKAFELTDSSRKAYMKELRKVVDRADVVLEVLDARDPIGCRALEMEDAICRRPGKKLVLVLNKIDLVPPHVLQPWLHYLRGFYPTVAFKASTQSQANRLSTAVSGKADHLARLTENGADMVFGSKAVGTDALMQLLKNYCRNHQVKTAITVGIIGYPNVGKSSVINSLKRSKAAGVSSTAGHTRVMQEIHIDSKIKLLDCPGIVFDHSDAQALLLRNCINTDTMTDPVGAVQVLLERCDAVQLAQLYKLPTSNFSDVIAFLVAVAGSKGKLGKGGVPDRLAAARIVLQDWNRGKIPFFTPPPTDSATSQRDSAVVLDAQIVESFADDFDVDRVLNPTSIFLAEHSEARQVPTMHPGSAATSAMPGVSSSSMDTSSTNAGTSKMNEVMRTLRDSDSDASDDDDDDSDEDMDDGGADAVDMLHQQQNKWVADPLNPLTAQAARRKAKAMRKLKRRAARQQIGAATESSISEQFEDSVALAFGGL